MADIVSGSNPQARPPLPTLEELASMQREFVRERGWDQYHSLKNLAIALSVESSELLQLFEWTNDSSASLDRNQTDDLAAEAADVLLFLLSICEAANIDLIAAAIGKLEVNRQRWPIGSNEGGWVSRRRRR